MRLMPARLTKWPGPHLDELRVRLSSAELGAHERLEPQAALGVRHGREQQLRVGVLRVEQHGVGRALLDDPAAVHHEHLVGDVARARDVVRDVEEGDSELPLELEDEIEDADADRHVEHRDRLVGQDHARLDGERPCDRDALALPARELVRVLLRDLVGRHETDAREQLAHPPVDGSARADAVDQQRPRDVVIDALDRIERGERILEDHLHVRAVVEQRPAAAADRRRPGRRTGSCRRSARTGARAGARRCSCRCRSRPRARSRDRGAA